MRLPAGQRRRPAMPDWRFSLTVPCRKLYADFRGWKNPSAMLKWSSIRDEMTNGSKENLPKKSEATERAAVALRAARERPALCTPEVFLSGRSVSGGAALPRIGGPGRTLERIDGLHLARTSRFAAGRVSATHPARDTRQVALSLAIPRRFRIGCAGAGGSGPGARCETGH